MEKRSIRMMLPVLLLLIMNLTGCAKNIRYLTNKDRIWIIPKNVEVKTTEGTITTDEELVAGYRGHLFQDHIDADNQVINQVQK